MRFRPAFEIYCIQFEYFNRIIINDCWSKIQLINFPLELK